MTFKQSESIIPLSLEESCESTVSYPTNSSTSNLCLVCDDKALGVNYGALTCSACRAFFRRHGFRSRSISTCPFNKQCEVNIHKQQHKACTACRLNKCFAVGMNLNFFRPLKKTSQKSHSKDTQSDQPSTFVSYIPTLDLLHYNRSNLTSSHWTLLSNVIYAYDNYSLVSAACSINEKLSKLPNSQLFDVPLSVKICEYAIASIMSFIRCLPDFQILTLDEQNSLLERNLPGAIGFNYIFVLRDSGCIDNSIFITNTASVYGTEAITRLRHLKHQLDYDSTLIKLMFVIFTFSSNCSVLTLPDKISTDALLLGTFRLLGSQNVYVELLWKYMIYRYGYHETVIRFAYLVKQLLDLIDHMTKSCMKVKTYDSHFEKVYYENKNSSSNSSNQDILVWGNR